jgi:hypothetical protein
MTDRTVANIVAKTGRSEAEARASLAAMSPQNRLIRPRRSRRRALALRAGLGRGQRAGDPIDGGGT